jgi:PPM family protein phosphatase
MRSRGVGLAHVGQRRTNNEDSWVADEQLGLYLVADGMGGHSAGDVASAMAVSAALSTVREQRELLTRVQAGEAAARELMPVVQRALEAANEAVHSAAEQDPSKQGMGCTLTLLLIAGTRGIMAHVGDSRLYVSRGDRMHQLSQDQTVAADLVREGVLTQEQAAQSRWRNALSQAIGIKGTVAPDYLRFELAPGDRFLLCSDGLSNYVKDSEWLVEQLRQEDLEGIPGELVDFANQAGGSDNITAVVVEVNAEPSEDALSLTSSVTGRISAVGETFLCRDLSLARQARVLSHCELQHHAAGQAVVVGGDPLVGLYLVASGALEVEGAGTLSRGDFFGASAMVLPRAARVTVRASEPCETLLLRSEALQELSRSRPRLGLVLQRRIAQELARALEERLEHEATPPAALAP